MEILSEVNKNQTEPLGQELCVEKACQEYNDSVHLSLSIINTQMNDALAKNYEALEELALKMQVKHNFLEQNSGILWPLNYNSQNVQFQPILEFKELQVSIKEHSTRIIDKILELETHHEKFLDLLVKNSKDQRLQNEISKMKKHEEKPVEPQKPSDSVKTKSHQTFDTVTIKKDAFADANLQLRTSFVSPIKCPVFDDIPPNVERQRPLENIHGRLIKQLEAADSLEGFLRLMNRKPKKPKKDNTCAKSHNLQEKYTGSLYFFSEKNIKSKQKTSTICASPKTLKRESTLLTVNSSPTPIMHPDRKEKSPRNLNKRGLKCYDLLDDVSGKDIKPIESEYPRRDTKTVDGHNGSKTTYLHRIMKENDKVWQKLLQPVSLKPEEKRAKTKDVKNLMAYLTAPEQKILNHIPQSLIVMPVKIYYENVPIKDPNSKPKTQKQWVELPKLIPGHKKQETSISPSAPETKRLDEQNAPLPSNQKKEILTKLKSLKVKNTTIQEDIQKAIDVIESEMINLLSSSKTSTKAFTTVETEITNLLKMMSNTTKLTQQENDKILVNMDPKPKSAKVVGPRRKKNVEVLKLFNGKPQKQIHEKTVKITTKVGKLTDDVGNKKAANIQEGERILGEVDNVIKKIDSIYSKFYDDAKIKNVPNQKNFEGAERRSEEILIAFCGHPEFEIPVMISNARCFRESKLYYPCNRGEIKPKQYESGDFKENEIAFEAMKETPLDITKAKILNDSYQSLKEDHSHEEIISIVENFSETLIALHSCTTTPKTVEKLCDNHERSVHVTTLRPIQEVPFLKKFLNAKQIERYEMALNSFYIFFFSGLLFALHLNYAV